MPNNSGLSLRHTTRNFPNREGSKPGEGQVAAVALMDARSIAATARNGGFITPATEVDYQVPHYDYHFDPSIYEKRVYNGYGHPQPETQLRYGPNITDWPKMYPLTDNLLLELAAVIRDPVTTTDELIPSGETSSYRSNPLRLAEFALSRRVPEYVGRSKAINQSEADRREGKPNDALLQTLGKVGDAQPWPKPRPSPPACSPTSPATAPPGSRPPPAKRYWAAAPTSATNTPPSATGATASTGACYPLPCRRALISPMR